VQIKLNQKPSDNLRVYAVWIAMLGGDSRDDWNGRSMPDPRVKNFWDGEYIVGRWFAKQVDGFDGIAWDVYYLYGPDAVWEDLPSPLVSSGSTIYGERETLEKQMRALLEK
jgi:hypothetical protein